MVNSVVPRTALDEKVDALVASIAASSPTAISIGRRALAMIDGLSLEAGLEYAQRVLPQMARTAGRSRRLPRLQREAVSSVDRTVSR